jgi:hypothetical protein
MVGKLLRYVFILFDAFLGLWAACGGVIAFVGVHGFNNPPLGFLFLLLAFGLFASAYAIEKGLLWQKPLRGAFDHGYDVNCGNKCSSIGAAASMRRTRRSAPAHGFRCHSASPEVAFTPDDFQYDRAGKVGSRGDVLDGEHVCLRGLTPGRAKRGHR